MTSYIGAKCDEDAIGYIYGPSGRTPGVLVYNVADPDRATFTSDSFAVGFFTNNADGVIMKAVGQEPTGDYYLLKLEDGYVVLEYSLDGKAERRIVERTRRFDDNRYHVVRVNRTELDIQLQVDSHTLRRGSAGSDKRFDNLEKIYLGGLINSHFRVEQPFWGLLSGFNYNSIRPMDLAAINDPSILWFGQTDESQRPHTPPSITVYPTDPPSKVWFTYDTRSWIEYDMDKAPSEWIKSSNRYATDIDH